jgi:hypothetical protein
VFVLTEEQRLEVQRINRERIESTPVEAMEIAQGEPDPACYQSLTTGESQ